MSNPSFWREVFKTTWAGSKEHFQWRHPIGLALVGALVQAFRAGPAAAMTDLWSVIGSAGIAAALYGVGMFLYQFILAPSRVYRESLLLIAKIERERDAAVELTRPRRPLIPPGPAVRFPALPFDVPVSPLTEEQYNAILTDIATRPAPQIRVEISGFVFQSYPKDVQRALSGAGELMASFKFPVHILNQSQRHRASLQFMAFHIEPGFTHGRLKTEGITTNLGPEEDTEGFITVLIEPSMYARLTRGRHLKLLHIKELVSGLDRVVTIPTDELELFVEAQRQGGQ